MLNLIFLCFQIPALINPQTDMHFNMNLIYTFISVILLIVYGQVMFDADEGNKTLFLHAINLHWFRLIIKLLDLEGLDGIFSKQRLQTVLTVNFVLG